MIVKVIALAMITITVMVISLMVQIITVITIRLLVMVKGISYCLSHDNNYSNGNLPTGSVLCTS